MLHMTKLDKNTNHVRMNIRLSAEVHDYYKQRSEQTGASMSALMFLALEKASREERFMNEGIQDLLKAAQGQSLKKK